MILKIQSDKTGKILTQVDMQNCAMDGFTEFVEKWGLEKRVNELVAMNAAKKPELVLIAKVAIDWPVSP